MAGDPGDSQAPSWEGAALPNTLPHVPTMKKHGREIVKHIGYSASNAMESVYGQGYRRAVEIVTGR